MPKTLIYLNFDPMGFSRARKLKMKHKNNVLLSLRLMDEHPRRLYVKMRFYLNNFSLKISYLRFIHNNLTTLPQFDEVLTKSCCRLPRFDGKMLFAPIFAVFLQFSNQFHEFVMNFEPKAKSFVINFLSTFLFNFYIKNIV